MIYVDGSALCRFLPGVRHAEAWQSWVGDHQGELVTTQLGFTELRQAAELYPRRVLDAVLKTVDAVRESVGTIRFSDENVTISSHASAVLKPFAALHVGAAVAHEKVDTVATYDPTLAHVAQIYQLDVVSPGLADDWYLQYEGPAEEWEPVGLDAPYAPGEEYEGPASSPKPDAYEKALQEALAGEAPAEGDDGEAEDEGAEPASDAPEEDAVPASGRPASDEAGDDAPEGELEVALREAEAAALARAGGESGPSEGLGSEVESVEAESPAAEPPEVASDEPGPAGAEPSAPAHRDEVIARIGTYRPKVEAWREDGPEPHIDESPEIPVDVEPPVPPTLAAGRPGSERPGDQAPADAMGEAVDEGEVDGREDADEEVGEDTVGAGPGEADAEAIAGGHEEPTTPAGPRLRRTSEEATIGAGSEDLGPAPELAPPSIPEQPSVPTLKRQTPDEPGPHEPGSDVGPIGAPARRPMMDADPSAPARPSRPPEPVPPVPPEDSKPLTVPIKWNVELDEPESYAPQRFEPSARRPRPADALPPPKPSDVTLHSEGPVEVPGLEPSAAPPASRSGSQEPVREQPRESSSGESSRERKAREKREKKERERKEKLAKKGKGMPPPPPPDAPEDGASWRLDDVLGQGDDDRRR